MREKITVTFSDTTEQESYIIPDSFVEAVIGYRCILEDGSTVYLQRHQVRMVVVSEEEE